MIKSECLLFKPFNLYTDSTIHTLFMVQLLMNVYNPDDTADPTVFDILKLKSCNMSLINRQCIHVQVSEVFLVIHMKIKQILHI